MRKTALVSFIILLAVAGGILGWRVYAKLSVPVEERQRPLGSVAVEVSPITRGSIKEVRRLTGTLTAARQGDVAPKISGRIEELSVDLGDKVSRGDLIARLDSDELEQAYLEAKSDLEVAKANLEKARSEEQQARREYDRIAKLAERQVASESDRDNAELTWNVRQSNVRVSEAQVEQQQAAVRTAEIRLSYAEIHAEWGDDGSVRSVAERHVEPGELVSPNEPIVTLVDLSVLNAVLYVTERDYPSFRLNQEVEVHAEAFPNRVFSGKVTRMAPRFQESSRQARIEVAVPNPDEILKPGMFVRASVLLNEKTDVVLVPARAVVVRDRQNGVYIADRAAGTARYVPVVTGIEQNGMIEIESPAIEGEVVTLGQNLIDETTPLTFVEAERETQPDDAATTTANAAGEG
ncbi:MAG: hypothetical protein PWP23_2482 [Candidatus Sumerlaeota bacterium]|nr:hypothetical protein [Candidatus Sumerlaeota bacterium]